MTENEMLEFLRGGWRKTPIDEVEPTMNKIADHIESLNIYIKCEKKMSVQHYQQKMEMKKSMFKWIPTSERLPNSTECFDSEWFLVTVSAKNVGRNQHWDHFVTVLQYDPDLKEWWSEYHDNVEFTVHAWQCLPEEYDGD